MDKSIRILNFDNSVIKQEILLSRYHPEIIDLTDIAPRIRLWMDEAGKQAVQERTKDSSADSITFIGSGDFHHISHILLSRFTEPLSVIIFDFHPDWDTLPPKYGCGSWVTQTLKNNNILKVILTGVSSSDISSWWLQSGNLASLENNRAEIYPYWHKPSLVFFKKIPPNVSFDFRKGFFFNKIYWNNLKGRNLKEFFLSVLKRLPAKRVYISIDKDCLKKEYALTNWEEGMMPLEELLFMLELIRENFEIVGVDITGDYSPISVYGRLKNIFSKIDHPRNTGSNELTGSLIAEINEKTNLEILKIISP